MMDTKTVYQYDKNGIYIGEFTLDDTDKSPISRRWQIPAYMTEIVPPQEKEGFNRTWNGDAWEYMEIPKEPEPEPPTLDEIKISKIAEFKAKRDSEEVANIEYAGDVFDYDDKARERLQIARQSLADSGVEDASIVWTTADNQRVTLTVQDFAGINSAAAYRSNALHVKYNQLKEAVNACETVEEVEVITWENE